MRLKFHNSKAKSFRSAIVMIIILLTLAFMSILTVSRVNAASSSSPRPLLCAGATSLCADFEAVPISLLSTTFSAQSKNSVSPSYTWDFGDGTFGSGNPITHSYASPNEYLVKLIVVDGNTVFSVSHDVTEVGSLPATSFAIPSASSLNSNVSCKASYSTISGMIGDEQNSNGGADLAGAHTTSMLMKHTLAYPCSLYGYSVFIELHNVTVAFGPYTTTDCSNFPSAGLSCDVVGNLADGTGYMHAIRWEVERHWNASGEVSQFGDFPQTDQRLDVQGFAFWSFLAPADAAHDYSGWYLELTAWQPSSAQSQPPAQPPVTQKCLFCGIFNSWTSNIWILSVTGFLFGLSLVFAFGRLREIRKLRLPRTAR